MDEKLIEKLELVKDVVEVATLIAVQVAVMIVLDKLAPCENCCGFVKFTSKITKAGASAWIAADAATAVGHKFDEIFIKPKREKLESEQPA